MQTRTSTAALRLLLIVLFVVLFIFFIYTFLHEAGHAITGLIFGQSLTEFNVNFWDFSAHVEMTGGELTQSQLAIQALAGVSLPLLIWAIFISFVPRKASFTLETLKLLASMVVLNTLLAWMVIPVLYVFGKAPASDDVTKFLQYSQMPPLLLTFTVLVVYVRGWAYFLSKIENWRNVFLFFRTIDRDVITAGTSQALPVMAGIMALCAVLTFMLNSLSVLNPLDRFSPPQDFAPVAEIDLSAQAYSTEMLAQFSLEEPAYVGILTAIRNINTTYVDLRIVGPHGYSSIVLHGEGYHAERDGGLWEEHLLPGTYQVVLTSDQSPGTVSVYLKTPHSE